MFIIIVLVLILAFLYDRVTKNSRQWKMIKQFPGDYPLPFIGNALQIGFNINEMPNKLLEMWERHGRGNFKVVMGSKYWVFLSEPDDIGTLLGHSKELFKFEDKNKAVITVFGHSLAGAQGEKWRSTRKLLTPYLGFGVLEKRIGKINGMCDRLIDLLKVHSDKEPINMYYYIQPHMIDTICEILFGVKTDFLYQRDHPYMYASHKINEILTESSLTRSPIMELLNIQSSEYKKMKNILIIMKENSNNIISQRRKIINDIRENIKENNQENNVDIDELLMPKLSEDGYLLDALLTSKLSNGDPVPEETMREEIDLLSFTGHYTNTMTVSHTLYYIAKYPDIQNRLLEEQNSIFANDKNRHATSQQLNEMKFLKAVIKETMRHRPTITKLGRKLKEDLKLKDGRTIPAGASVLVHYHGLSFNPKVYEDPYSFNPDRFLDGDSVHPYSLVPFSAGPRNCIGFRYSWMVMTATLSRILRNFEIVGGGPQNEPNFIARTVTNAKNGVHLKLNSR